MFVQRSGMEKTLEGRFISRVSAFLGRSGLSPTAFGKKAMGDPNLMRQIGRGRSPSLRTADRILAFIAEQDRASAADAIPLDARDRQRPTRTRSTTRKSRTMTENPRSERTNPPIRFLRLPEVMKRPGLSRSTIYVRVAAVCFPRPVARGGRAVGWIEAGWRAAEARPVR